MSRGVGQGQKAAAAAFHGTWRIIETELWDVDALDLVEPAHGFDPSGLGELQLIAIGAAIDYRVSGRDGVPFVEFSWAGYDNSDSASGRGWARLEPGGVLKGRLFIHQGDESAFAAYREAEAPSPGGASRRKPSNSRLQPSRARRARR